MDAVSSPAQLLRAARLAAGLSQRALASRAGTSASAINRYELGRVVPELTTLRRILDACGFELRLGMSPAPGGEYGQSWEPAEDRRAIASALDAGRETVGWVVPAAVPDRATDTSADPRGV